MSHPFCILARFASTVLRSLPVLLLLSALGALTPQPARAASDAETADVVVDIFVKSGQLAGLPIPKEAAPIVKQIVTCGLDGTPVEKCVRNMAVATALKQIGTQDKVVSDAIGCLLDGTKVASCAVDAAIAKLPAEAQPMASCMIAGQGDIAGCTKKFAEGAILNKIPTDFQPVAKCMIDSGDPKKCGTAFVVQQITSKLPPNLKGVANQLQGCLANPAQAATCVASVAGVPKEYQPLVGCAAGDPAKVGQCAANNIPGMPNVAKGMVACVGQADFAKCAEQATKNAAVSQAEQQFSRAQRDAIAKALKTIDDLNPDKPLTIRADKDHAATIKNIMMVAQGVKDGKWDQIIMGAGPELAIIASNIILSVFLTPALAGALSPAVEAMIHNDAAAIQQALDAISNGDPVTLGKVIFTWYYTSFIDKPCALLSNETTDKVCGALSTALRDIAETGGDVAKDLLDKGKDVLEFLGLWKITDSVATWAWNTVKDIAAFFGFGDREAEWKPAPECGSLSPKGYLANNYMTCLSKATDLQTSTGGVDTRQLDDACTAQFNRCIPPESRAAVGEVCGSMADALKAASQKISEGIKTTADVYTGLGGPQKFVDIQFKESIDPNTVSVFDFCSPNFWDAAAHQGYASQCAKFVNLQYPLPREEFGGPVCGDPLKPPGERGGLVTSAFASRKACMDSLAANTAKASLTGPDGEYCKKQKDWEEANPPCKVITRDFRLPDGRVIQEPIGMDCGNQSKVVPPFIPRTPGHEVLVPPKLIVPPFRPSGPGRELLGSPRGSSGIGMIDGRTGNSPTSKPEVLIKRNPSPPKRSPVLAVRPPASGGSSGSNTVRSGALDRLTGDGMGGGMVGGSRAAGSSGSNGVVGAPGRKTMPGGSGNSPSAGVINSRPMGSSGSNAIINNPRPMGGGGTVNSQSRTAPAGSSRPDPNLLYGGCSSCNKPDPVRVR
jgi:hypothetical protein